MALKPLRLTCISAGACKARSSAVRVERGVVVLLAGFLSAVWAAGLAGLFLFLAACSARALLAAAMRAWAAFWRAAASCLRFSALRLAMSAKRALRRCSSARNLAMRLAWLSIWADRARLSVWAVEFSRPSLPSAACFCALRVLRRATSALMAVSCAPNSACCCTSLAITRSLAWLM